MGDAEPEGAQHLEGVETALAQGDTASAEWESAMAERQPGVLPDELAAEPPGFVQGLRSGLNAVGEAEIKRVR